MTCALLDVATGSNNLGDGITVAAIRRHLGATLAQPLNVPTHSSPALAQALGLFRVGTALVGGSNILSSHMERQRLLNLGLIASMALRHKLVCCGVGWWSYESPPCRYTRAWYRAMLMPGARHSVRDGYTQARLADLGVPSLVTGCPTTWDLPDTYAPASREVAGAVVTVTDYNQSAAQDRAWLREVSNRYADVGVVLFGKHDAEYVRGALGQVGLRILGEGVEALSAAVEEGRDYIGTRLHPGILVLSLGGRSLILNIDNRGTEMAGDLNLPAIARSEAAAMGLPEIGALYPRRLKIPREAVAEWLTWWRWHVAQYARPESI